MVAREGDPFAAMAFAVAQDFGATASLWLSAVVENRVEKAVRGASEARASGLGFSLAARISTKDDAAHFVAAVASALGTTISDSDRARAAERLRGKAAVIAEPTAAERAVGACSGELGAGDPRALPSTRALEGYRRAAFSAGSVAFAAVGPRPILDAASAALGKLEPWPSGAPDDAWPEKDVVGTASGAAESRLLSVALRVPDAARALAGARLLGERDSALATHVAALEPAWEVTRITGVVRPRGACLRVDVASTGGSDAPPLDDAARVAAMVSDEADRALAAVPSDSNERDRGILESADPRDAARIAAWQALGGKRSPGSSRLFVSYGANPDPSDPSGEKFARALTTARAEAEKPTVELKGTLEIGQGELWALLASPCATVNESVRDAGEAALGMRALARSNPLLDGVRVEPWVSSYGIGILVHAPRLLHESAREHAARLGEALGRVFVTSEMKDRDVAIVRAETQKELVAETEPLWPTAFEALAPGHPSLLDPRGTWQSVTNLSVHAVDAERHSLLRGPLRLAVIANEDASEGEVLRRSLERWLRPERIGQSRCAPPLELLARPGEYDVQAPSSEGSASRALVGVTVPLSIWREIPPDADWLSYLLNAPDGLLKRAVETPGLAAGARAMVLGSNETAALVVDVTAPDSAARQAVAQVRALLARLSEGALTATDAERARAALGKSVSGVADPRARLTRLFLGHSDPKDPDLGSLRQFARALAPSQHVVVLAKPR